MTQLEQAAIDACVAKCVADIYVTIRLFHSVKRIDKKVIQSDVEYIVQRYIKDLENADRN